MPLPPVRVFDVCFLLAFIVASVNAVLKPVLPIAFDLHTSVFEGLIPRNGWSNVMTLVARDSRVHSCEGWLLVVWLAFRRFVYFFLSTWVLYLCSWISRFSSRSTCGAFDPDGGASTRQRALPHILRIGVGFDDSGTALYLGPLALFFS